MRIVPVRRPFQLPSPLLQPCAASKSITYKSFAVPRFLTLFPAQISRKQRYPAFPGPPIFSDSLLPRSPLLSYSSELFARSQKPIPSLFNHFQTLPAKHPGGDSISVPYSSTSSLHSPCRSAAAIHLLNGRGRSADQHRIAGRTVRRDHSPLSARHSRSSICHCSFGRIAAALSAARATISEIFFLWGIHAE